MRFCSEKGISKNDELVQFLNVNGLTKENLVDSLLRPLKKNTEIEDGKAKY